LGSGMQPSTIAAILLQSMHTGVGSAVRKQAALAGIESEEAPVPLTALTSESLSLLQQLRATTWAVQLDEASASLLSELEKRHLDRFAEADACQDASSQPS
jgi:hypothetical protein